MLARIGRNRSSRNDVQDDEPSIHGVSSLLGGDGISLNGESVELPEDAINQGNNDDDDISSINTSIHGGVGAPTNFKIIGHGDEPIDTRGPSGGPGRTRRMESEVQIMETPKQSVGAGGGIACCPTWITGAKPWLKGVIALSIAVLVGAVVLIVVATGLIGSEKANSTNSALGTLPVASSDVASSTPSLAPVSTIVPTQTPSLTPVSTLVPTQKPAQPPNTRKPSTAPLTLTLPVQTLVPSTLFQAIPPVTTTEHPITPAPIAAESKSPVSNLTPAPVVNTDSPLVSTPAPVVDNQANTPTATAPLTLAPISDMDTIIPTATTVLYLMAGRPPSSSLQELNGLLGTIPDEGDSFMVHLGDWNSPVDTSCNEQSYQDISDKYSSCPFPVFFIPGDNEYNDCPDPESAFSFWMTYLSNYETKFWNPTSYVVERDGPDYEENFAFVLRRVLYIGINLVSGTIHNATEWSERQQEDLNWIQLNYERNQNDVNVMVVFSHSDPSIEANAPFFDSFNQSLTSDYNIATIIMHRNLGTESWSVQQHFNGITDYVDLVVEGGIWPPMRVEIDSVGGTFVFNQDTWYDEMFSGN